MATSPNGWKIFEWDEKLETHVAGIRTHNLPFVERTLLDIYDYCMENNSKEWLLFIHFRKAFDSIGWNQLFKVFKELNFDNDFIGWVKILYNKPIFTIKRINFKKTKTPPPPKTPWNMMKVIDSWFASYQLYCIHSSQNCLPFNLNQIMK